MTPGGSLRLPSVTGCGPRGKMGPRSMGKHVQWVWEEASS